MMFARSLKNGDASWLRTAAVLIVACVVPVAGGYPRAAPGRPPAPLRSPPVEPGPARYALLIGVSHYERGRKAGLDWWDLNAGNDVEALRHVLAGKFQFEQSHIKVLRSRQETTRAAILSTFRSFLIDRVRRNDVVFIHFSGHGGQVADDDGDEFDGLDETLVPSDYVSRSDASRNIRDDTLGQLLAELRTREPASITVTLDSCFSGTATRGGRELVRGEGWRGQPPISRPVAGRPDDTSGLLTEREAAANGYVLISAARHDQVAKETDDGSGKHMGLFSFALAKTLPDAGPQTTYRDLFDRIVAAMDARNPGQTPQLEGDLDKVVLSGAALPAARYVEVRTSDDGTLRLQAGSLQGMTAGSRFSLYPTGTREFEGTEPIARAEVADVGVTTASLKLVSKPSVNLGDLHFARAVETAHTFRDDSLVVDMVGLDGLRGGDPIRATLQALSSEQGLISVDPGSRRWDVRICASVCPDETTTAAGPVLGEGDVVLVRHDGTRIAALRNDSSAPAQIRRALENEARWRMVRSLDHADARMPIAVKLVPVDVELTGQSVTRVAGDKALERGAGGELVLRAGDHFMLEVRNGGDRVAYLTVLDVRPDGSLGPMWPHPRVTHRVQENVVPPDGRWHRIPAPYVFLVNPPCGTETIKAIATAEPADFSLVLDPATARGSSADSPGASSPLGRLLRSATLAQRSELAGQTVDQGEWSTDSLTFQVVGTSAECGKQAP